MKQKLFFILLGLLPLTIFGQGLYQENLNIPVYDSQNSEMVLITASTADSVEMILNDASKRIFFIQPGDYTDERITISEDGTSGSPKWLIYYDPQNPTDYTTHPVNMAPSDCATFQRMNLLGAHWIFDRIRSVGDGTRNPSLSLLDDYIVLNRCLVELSGGGAGQIAMGEYGGGKGPSNYGVIQNCVIRNTQITEGEDNHGIKVERGDYNRIVHNEIYNFAGDGIQFGLNYGPFKGSVVYDNDIYNDISKYHQSVSEIPHENGIDIKYAGASGAGEHLLIKNNRFRNLSHTPGGTSPNLDQGAIDHSNDGVYKSYELIEDNVFYDCRISINTKGGNKTDHFTIRRNLIYQSERYGIWIPKTAEHHHDIYLNTIIDVQGLNGDLAWYSSRSENCRITGNVIIDGGTPSDEPQSGTVSDYNAFYNTDSLDYERSHSISYGNASDANQTSYTFSMGMFTGPVNYTIPNARPTSSSPHINLTSGITFGSTSGVGYNNNDTYTQNCAGALLPSTNGNPPVVSITNPSNSATVDGTITITATASDSDNDLAGVQFKIDGVNIGSEITSAPFSVSWNTTNESEGNHIITATARDNNNNTSSSSVTVLVDNEADVAPVVSITSPSNQSTVNGTITVTASASDDNNDLESVQFKLNGNNLGSPDTSSPYSYSWNTQSYTDGTYVLTAVATDEANNSTTSSSVTVTIANGNAPSVTITSPTNGSTVSETINIVANASDSDGDLVGVQFKLDGNNLGSQDNTSPYSYSWNTSNVSNGTYTLTAVAVDAQNNTTTSSSVSVTVFNGTGGCITLPNNNTWVNTDIGSQTDNFTIEYDITPSHTLNAEIGLSLGNVSSDNYIAALIRLESGKIKARDNQGFPSTNIPFSAGNTYHIKMDIDLTNHTYDVFANEIGNSVTQLGDDFDFHSNSSSITEINKLCGILSNSNPGYQVDICNIEINGSGGSTNTPPSVSISSPSNEANYSVGDDITIIASASDSDGSITSVEFFHGSTSLGTDSSSPYSVTINNASAGTYNLTAVATDDDAATTTSGVVSVTVSASNQSPTVSITSPSNGAEFTEGDDITISVSASDSDGSITSVEFFNGSTSLGTDSSSPYSYTLSNVSAGSYNLSAVATDNDGASSSDNVSVTVSTEDSTECIILPNTNSWVNTNIGSQTDDFTIDFDITPSHNLNAEIGLSLGDVSSDNYIAALLKLESGKIKARDNQGFPSTNLPFSAGNTYHIKMHIDLEYHTYDVFANEEGSSAIQIGDGFDFHSNSSSITEINRLSSILKNTNTGYQVDICNITISDFGGEKSAKINNKFEDELSTLKVYPNPFGDFIKIHTGGELIAGRYTLATISGTIVKQGIIPENDLDFTIQTENIKTGMYILSLDVDGMEPRTLKIIKY